MSGLYNVYKWRTRGPRSRAVRVWQGEARHGPAAILKAHTAKPQLRGWSLFARCAHDDPYAGDPNTLIEEDQR